MRIASLMLTNFGPYKGEHTLDLEAKAYAIVARRKDDPERSNWAGKSTLCEAVRFALYGKHRHRLEDGWITDGEAEGGVSLRFDDHTVVRRTRRRGKSTRFVLSTPSASDASGDQAQSLIEGVLGLSLPDFGATCYFEQRHMARLVLLPPSERMGVVSGWLGLEPLVAAEKIARERVADLAARAASFRQELAMAQVLEKRAKELFGDEAPELRIKKAVHDYEASFKVHAQRVEEVEKNERAFDEQRRAAERAQVIADGKALREKVDAAEAEGVQTRLSAARTEWEAATLEHKRLGEEVTRAAKVARGEFDGQCPVVPMSCPAKAQINGQLGENRRHLGVVQARFAEAGTTALKASKALAPCEARVQELERNQGRLEQLRAHARTLPIESEVGKAEPRPREELRAKLQRAAQSLAEDQARVEVLEQAQRLIAGALQAQTLLEGQLRAIEAQLATAREMLLIFGKQGAQRRVAEDALREIERGANAMLGECAIPLEVQVQWSREGEGLAEACDGCGYPFPRSARAKQCERCGAARGANIINRLEVDLSSRSGAAEDLAGAAIQLSASAWLRRRRSARWSCALIDEPFGQLDPVNRRTLATHLAALLRGRYGYEQAFIISHSSATADSFPGKIEVTSDGRFSEARVAA